MLDKQFGPPLMESNQFSVRWRQQKMLGERVDRNEVWDVWVMEQADRQGILKVMNGASQGIINENI